MKKLLLTAIISMTFATTAWSETVSILTPKDGLKVYDVQRRGRQLEVYDYENGEIKFMNIEPGGALLDMEGNLYDVQMDRDGEGGSVYDYESGEIHYFDIDR